MKHHLPSQLRRLSCGWLLLALLGQAALSACGSSTAPAGSDATGAAALHCAPASAKPDGSAARTVTQTAALCAPQPQRRS